MWDLFWIKLLSPRHYHLIHQVWHNNVTSHSVRYVLWNIIPHTRISGQLTTLPPVQNNQSVRRRYYCNHHPPTRKFNRPRMGHYDAQSCSNCCRLGNNTFLSYLYIYIFWGSWASTCILVHPFTCPILFIKIINEDIL